ncbi:MAG TPA: ferrochelatase [Terriglobales bacterium]|jgi:ferrochelatase|nr:ferrochelatase [Terriglobales bacterium]
MSSSDKIRQAVLLLAHGSPDSVDQIPEFLSKVTGGRPLPVAVVEEVKHRYAKVGCSPLTDLTVKQGELLSRRLRIPVYVGMRNWHPLVADTLARMNADGVTNVSVICMAPQNSRTSVGLYRNSLRGADCHMKFDFVESWHDQPRLIQSFAEKLRTGLEGAEKEYGKVPPVIFTAHSVPERTILEGDPYEDQAKDTAYLVAAAVGLDRLAWKFAFQSQGMSGGTWLGPTVEQTILQLKAAGKDGVFIQPVGFLCDNIEILYDIDIGFQAFAQAQGMRLWRAESLNTSPLLTEALAEIVHSRTSVPVGN